jgi:filamentous hemagglutinin
MNKHLYRVIWNVKRQACMVVREDSTSESGGSIADQEHTTHTPNTTPRISIRLGLKWLGLCVGLVCSGMSLSSGIIADPNAGTNRPIVDTSANGKPIVHIVAPNAAGISHNQYQQFNVGSGGAILNNSGSMTQTQQGGWIDGNPNLNNRPHAQIILNEVTHNRPSQLTGYLEVAGSNAQVIIANPSGIYCNGCGFINSDRVMLTTGRPVFGGQGSLSAFRVTGGNIRIEGQGLDGSRVREIDLLSRSLEVYGKVYAQESIHALTGIQEVGYKERSILICPRIHGQLSN